MCHVAGTQKQVFHNDVSKFELCPFCKEVETSEAQFSTYRLIAVYPFFLVLQLVCIQTNCKLQTNCNIQTSYKLQTFGLNYKPRLIENYRLLALIINYRLIP